MWMLKDTRLIPFYVIFPVFRETDDRHSLFFLDNHPSVHRIDLAHLMPGATVTQVDNIG